MSLAASKTAASAGMRRPAAQVARPLASSSGSGSNGVAARPSLPRRVPATVGRRAAVVARATEAEIREVQLGIKAQAPTDGFVPVCLPEELPKGVRKEVEVDGKPVLLFWYRNQIYAIQGRSPAEGAYTEGFIKAKFTQDYCIECPSTASLFSIRDGSVVSWYPNNPVLRALTPRDTAKPMEIYPVKLTQRALMVDVSASRITAPRVDRGGAGTSLENNNVFTVQPNVYFEGMDPSVEQASVLQDGPGATGVSKTASNFVLLLAVGSLAAVAAAIVIYVTSTN